MDFALYASVSEGKEAEKCICVCLCVCVGLSCSYQMFFMFYFSERRTVCLSPTDTQPECVYAWIFVCLRGRVMESFCVLEREDVRVCVCVCVCNCEINYFRIDY